MAAGDFTHRGHQQAKRLAPYRDLEARVYSAALLPYERDLIATIGCSEDEYRWYRARVAARITESDFNYAIVNGPLPAWAVSALVSLAIGAVTTAVSYFLTPRPNVPSQDASREKRLADFAGRSRFNQTYGFEGAPDIAEYGLPIPIIFGRYEQRESHTTGGILVAPSLVWSRMLSFGSAQGYKGLYAIGETSITAPDITGIFLGTLPLASLPEQQYALYWASRDGDNRIKADDLIAGSRATPYAGDPEPYDDVFQCPTLSAMVDTGFSSVYTPTGNTVFGAYDPIKNGTFNKINWRVVSIPRGEDPQGRLSRERHKIAGEAARRIEQGMRGTGAGYGCFMGLIAHRPAAGGYSQYEYPTLVTINVGDEVIFNIGAGDYDDNIFPAESGVTMEDQRQRTIRERQEADDKLQYGELFIIGRAVFQVVNRPDDVWYAEGPGLHYTLRCIELTGGSNQIGIAGTASVNNTTGYDGNAYASYWVGPSWFPLLRVSLATVRNQRPVDATEIGIRSQVWNRANGLCNFPEIPTPRRMVEFDEGNTVLSNGNRSSYFARTSVFTIQLRPAGLAPNGEPYPWALLGEQFCVTGISPVEQFNFIRLKPRTRGQYEYRFIPKSGADVRQFSPLDTQFLRLDAKNGVLLGADYDTTYGPVRVTAVGQMVTAGAVSANSEFRSTPRPGSVIRTLVGSQIDVIRWLPEYLTRGKFGGWHTHYLGDPKNYKNQTRAVTFTISSGSKVLTLKVEAVSQFRSDQPLNDGWEWRNPSTMTYVSSTNISENEQVDFYVNVNNAFLSGSVGVRLNITKAYIETQEDPNEADRWFELKSQIADVSHYEEVEKSNNSNPEFTIVYVNESVENVEQPTYNNITTMGIALRSGRAIQSIDQVRAWVPNGVNAMRFSTGTVGPANKFSDLVYFLLTDERAGAGKRVSTALVDTDGFTRTAKFLVQNRIYFDGVIEEQTNIREYISGTAALHLCNFVIANGKFSIEPALPTNDDGTLNEGAMPIAALFTAGNIVEDTFSVNYVELGERQGFRALMTYREGAKNQLPLSRSALVQWADLTDSKAKTETFDLSRFCTYREQALLTARYLLSVRRRITHTITFKTTPEGLILAPGQYIRVIMKAGPRVDYRNGVIDAAGNVTCLAGELDGTYSIFAYRSGDSDVRDTTLTVSGGITTDSSLFGSLFTIQTSDAAGPGQSVYQVDQLTMDEGGLVEIQATQHPCDSSLHSLIVQDVLDPALFIVTD